MSRGALAPLLISRHKMGWKEGKRMRGNCCLGVCAIGLGAGILIAAIFPVGFLMFLVSFLLIACGIACLRDRRY